MRYVLNSRYRFRGWYKLPACILDTEVMDIRTFPIPEYTLLLRCDGAHDLGGEEVTQEEQARLNRFLQEGLIHEAEPGELLQEHQVYKTYPARYRKEVHWSVTGACNLRCRHCFMSAPQAKHGNPTHEEIIRVADQLAECGIFRVGITGGEPLIRKDLFAIIDAEGQHGMYFGPGQYRKENCGTVQSVRGDGVWYEQPDCSRWNR